MLKMEDSRAEEIKTNVQSEQKTGRGDIMKIWKNIGEQINYWMEFWMELLNGILLNKEWWILNKGKRIKICMLSSDDR